MDGPYKIGEGKLKTALLGLKDTGQLMLKAASASGYFQIQAVADTDTTLLETARKEYNCQAYDDYRQLIIQNQLDCLLVAAGIHSCDKHIRTAMKKKFNVLKLAPLARNFEEAAELVRLSENENIKFAVANPDRFAKSFLNLRDFLQQGNVEQISLITATYTTGNQSQPTWQSDPKLAGGGVLLYNCYQLMDQLILNFTVPQQVYSLTTSHATDRQHRLYVTEDTAALIMKFSDTSFANLIASNAFGSNQEFLKVYGKDKILTASFNRLTIADSLGQINEQFEYNDSHLTCMKKLLKNFELSILLPDKNKLTSSGRENLKNMAVIESAYLSARTGFPEQPSRILKMEQLEPKNILQGQ